VRGRAGVEWSGLKAEGWCVGVVGTGGWSCSRSGKQGSGVRLMRQQRVAGMGVLEKRRRGRGRGGGWVEEGGKEGALGAATQERLGVSGAVRSHSKVDEVTGRRVRGRERARGLIGQPEEGGQLGTANTRPGQGRPLWG